MIEARARTYTIPSNGQALSSGDLKGLAETVLALGARAARVHGWGLSHAVSGAEAAHANRIENDARTIRIRDLGLLTPHGVGIAQPIAQCERVANEARGYGITLSLPEDTGCEPPRRELAARLIPPGTPPEGLVHTELLVATQHCDEVEWLVPALDINACESLARAGKTLADTVGRTVSAIGRGHEPYGVRSALARAQRRIEAAIDPRNRIRIERVDETIEDAMDTLLGAIAERRPEAGRDRVEQIGKDTRRPHGAGASELARHYEKIAKTLRIDGWALRTWLGHGTPQREDAPRDGPPGTSIHRWRTETDRAMVLKVRAEGMPVVTWRAQGHKQWRSIALERTARGEYAARMPHIGAESIEVAVPERAEVEVAPE